MGTLRTPAKITEMRMRIVILSIDKREQSVPFHFSRQEE